MDKKSWIIIVLEAIVFILILGSVIKCNSDNIDLLEHNINSYKTKIEQVELDNGNLLIAKESLLLSESQMLEELEMTKKEVKDLKNKLGSAVAQINKLQAEIDVKDTVYMKPDTVFVDNKITTKLFTWNDQWTSLSAKVFGTSITDSQLSIYDLKMNLPIEFGMTNDYKVFVSTPNPYVKFTNMTSSTIYGSTIVPKPKRFHHGIYAGFGISYGMISNKVDIGPSFGYGFMYSF